MNDFRSAAHFDPSRCRLFRACIFVDIYKRAMHRSKKCLSPSVQSVECRPCSTGADWERTCDNLPSFVCCGDAGRQNSVRRERSPNSGHQRVIRAAESRHHHERKSNKLKRHPEVRARRSRASLEEPVPAKAGNGNGLGASAPRRRPQRPTLRRATDYQDGMGSGLCCDPATDVKGKRRAIFCELTRIIFHLQRHWAH
jgi:hypothetical protein